MTRTPFDQFAKQYLEELLTPYGQVEVSREIPGEARLTIVTGKQIGRAHV